MKNIESDPKVQSIGFRELREKSNDIIKRVSKGQSFVVKRRSKALFRIVPLEEEVWNTVVDFSEINPDGAPLDDVLQAIDDLKREDPEKYGRQDKKVSS